MADEPLRILIIGAHPDDCEFKAGGTSALWRAGGHVVRMVSMTNGDAGHHLVSGPELAARRKAEAEAAAAVIGCESEIVGIPDGTVIPSLEIRHTVIRLIRSFSPDLVLTHRTNDYHPDHRYTSICVQDAAYLVTVPAVCPDVPHLAKNPIFAYLSDDFTRPNAFSPTVAVDIGEVFGKLVDQLTAHRSQMFEWLPHNLGWSVPTGEAEQREWLSGYLRGRIRPLADRWRELLLRQYGNRRGDEVLYVEGFEGSEYGSPLDAAAAARLFPFVKPD